MFLTYTVFNVFFLYFFPFHLFLVRDAFVRTNCHTCCSSVSLPVWDGRACEWCDHPPVHFCADLKVYGWIVQSCSGHPDNKACRPIASRLFPVPAGREMGMDVQSRRDISRTVGDRSYKLPLSANRKSYMPRWLTQQETLTLNGRFTHCALSLR